MNKKYTYAKAGLCIGLLSFHTFSSCVQTRQELGIETNVRQEIDWMLGNMHRPWYTRPKKLAAYAAGGCALLCAGAAGIWGLMHIASGSNINGLAGSHAMFTTTASSIWNVTMTPPSNPTSELAMSTWASAWTKYGGNLDMHATTPFPMLSVSDLFDAIAQPNFQTSTLKQWIDYGLDVDLKDIDNFRQTLLMAASRYARLDIVNILIKRGAKPNAQDDNGATALMHAIFAGHPGIVNTLIKNEANPNLQDRNGHTALMHAVFTDHPDIVKILIKNEANPNLQDRNGHTALMHAVFTDHPGIAKILIDNKVNLNVQDHNGATVLMHAVSSDRPDIAKILIDNGADIGIKNVYGGTALDDATSNAMKALLSNRLSTVA